MNSSRIARASSGSAKDFLAECPHRVTQATNLTLPLFGRAKENEMEAMGGARLLAGTSDRQGASVLNPVSMGVRFLRNT